MPESHSGKGSAGECIEVALVYASGSQIWRRHLQVPAGISLGQALERSGFFRDHPGLLPQDVSAGIYGQRCSLEQGLVSGDRIEIYRPLIVDPMEARRRRAEHRRHKK